MRSEGIPAAVTAAWISVLGVVVAATIGGIFALTAAQRSAPTGTSHYMGQTSVPSSAQDGPTGSTTVPSTPSKEPPGRTQEIQESPPRPAMAEVILVVGIRPAYSQLAEDLSLVLDGHTVAHWQANQLQPSRTLTLELPTGSHRYSVRGTYKFMTPTGATSREAEGSGTVEILGGAHYGMPFYPATRTFEVQRIG